MQKQKKTNQLALILRAKIDRTSPYFKKRLVLISLCLTLFFISEITILWAVAEARVVFNPIATDSIVSLKKSRKNRSLTPPPKPTEPQKTEIPQENDSLIVGKLAINAVVEPVGEIANGEMGTSRSLYNVAWYRDGAVPGQVGSAVIAGHSGAPNEIGIFKSLDQLNAGDEISYKFKDGSVAKFAVYKKAIYPVDAMPLKDIFNKNDGKYLNLISCYGIWDYSTSRFDKRVVIYSKSN